MLRSRGMLIGLALTASLAAASGRGYEFGACEIDRSLYEPGPIQSLYIPMRDGVKIAVDLVLPANLPEGARLPTLLTMTRYWRAREGDGLNREQDFYVRHG